MSETQTTTYQIALLRRLTMHTGRHFMLRRLSEPAHSVEVLLPPQTYWYSLADLAEQSSAVTPLWPWEAFSGIDAVYGDLSDLIAYKRFGHRRPVVAGLLRTVGGNPVQAGTGDNASIGGDGQQALKAHGIRIQFRPIWERYDCVHDQLAARDYYLKLRNAIS